MKSGNRTLYWMSMSLLVASDFTVAAAQQGIMNAATVEKPRKSINEAFIVPSGVVVPEPEVEVFPPVSEKEKQILAALTAPTAIAFVETPLQEAIDYVKDAHGIQIVINEKCLNENAKRVELPVTLSISKVSLGAALRLMVRQYDLALVLHDEILEVTTPDCAAVATDVRVYPVADLADRDGVSNLMDLVRESIEPMTWSEVGGPGNIGASGSARSLVILQTPINHQAILELLRSLRAARRQVINAGR